ncbi:MAG: Ppx/GppA phosphatase family protein [Rhodospirillaceae bacterium]
MGHVGGEGRKRLAGNAATVAPSRLVARSPERTRGRGKAGPSPSSLAGAGSRAEIYSAVDLGTNNCRMLIARPEGETFRVIDSYSRITRLGEGLASTGCLSAAAQDRTIEALKRCVDKMDRRGVTASRSVATEACRRAVNGPEFLERVRSETGMDLECITANEEARLALTGCASLLHRDHPYALVFDIGGGSTELLWVKLTESPFPCVEGFTTLALGVVTVAEACGGGDLGERTYRSVVNHVRAQLTHFEARHGIGAVIAAGQAQMLGTSGTVTTLGGLHLGLTRYDRAAVDGLVIDLTTVHSLSRGLAAMSHRQRADSPCIGPQRADLVLAGCAILEAICETWPMPALRVADRGLREGMLLDLMSGEPSAIAAAIQNTAAPLPVSA